MTGTNYTNQNDRGRFGFSESGTFKAPYKGAHIVAALFIAAGISVDVIIFFIVTNYARSVAQESSLMFIAMVEALVIGIAVVLTIIVVVLGVRAVTSGFVCKYTANDEKFVMTIGGDIRTIYYKDVQTVHFIPRTSFGKVAGYDVTVRINGADENYAIVFDGFLSEKNTPFYIILERSEMIRSAEYNERAMLAGANSVGESNKPILAEDVAKAQEGKKDVYDRMAELLGKDAEMPGVALAKDDRNTARAVRAYKAEQEALAKNAPVIPEGIEGGYDVSKVMEKVSPAVGGYAADMPSLDKNGRVIVPDETHVGADGREVSIDDVIGRGTFHVPLSKKLSVILWATAAPLLSWTLFIACMFAYILIASPWLFGAGFFFSLQFHALWISAVLALVIALMIVKYIRSGKEYRYKANGREFVVTAKNRPEEHIYYNEVAGVTYSKLKFLGVENGYNVEITTTYGVIRYKFVYPRFRHAIKTEDLPFELIRKNAERLKKK